MDFINKFGALILAVAIAVVSCFGIFEGYSYVQESCLVYDSERSDEKIKKSGYIVYGTSADVFPLSYINRTFNSDECRYITDLVLNDKQYSTQIDIVYAQNIAKAMEVPLRIAYIPRGEMTDALKNGKVDIISSFALDEEIAPSLSSSSLYYTIKPVLVFGDEGVGKLSKVDSIHVYSDSKLESVIDKSQVGNASWKKVSTYSNLVLGLNDNTAYLTEISCVGDNNNYKKLNVISSEAAECRFLYRAENTILGEAIEEAISRVNRSEEKFSVVEQGSVSNEQSDEKVETDGFSRDDVMRTFAGNNFASGSDVFSGENGSFFVALDNKLYHYDSSANLINTYNDYMVGDEAFALDGKIYTIDQNDKTVCRVLDLQTQNASHITLDNKKWLFKSSSFRKARKLLKSKNETISYEDFVSLMGMFAANDLYLVEEDYLWKNWDSIVKKHMLRHHISKKQTEKYTNSMSLFGNVSSFTYNVYEGKAYVAKGTTITCYGFDGDAKIIAEEKAIGNIQNYITDSDGNMFVISQKDNNYDVYKWELYGFCDKIYSSETKLTNIYESGIYIIVYTDNSFIIMEKSSGRVVERAGDNQ